MNGKRLFWTSIIIVELVLVYVLWRPHWGLPPRPTHHAALTPPPAPAARSEIKPATPVARPAVASAKPSAIPKPHVAHRWKPPVVNASVISREPIPAKSLAPKTLLSPLESFWCQMSTIDANCNCKGDERAASLPMQ